MQSNTAHSSPGQRYQVRIKGHISPTWFTDIYDVTITHAENGETILVGLLPDQSALFGILQRIQNLALPLVSVIPLESET